VTIQNDILEGKQSPLAGKLSSFNCKVACKERSAGTGASKEYPDIRLESSSPHHQILLSLLQLVVWVAKVDSTYFSLPFTPKPEQSDSVMGYLEITTKLHPKSHSQSLPLNFQLDVS
jgi:hypothetical protein